MKNKEIKGYLKNAKNKIKQQKLNYFFESIGRTTISE
tara:strand:- start:293 stop:403 length:111 start_codon:yes stop_codon:yes gene_type:complete